MSNKSKMSLSAPETSETLKGQTIVYQPPETLKPYPGNARTHNERQITALMSAFTEFGFRGAVLVNQDNVILSGHGRIEAAKRLGLKEVPTILATGLTTAQEKAYVLADNKIAQLSKWDHEKLRNEIEWLIEDDFEIETTGFSTAEIDIMLDDIVETAPDNPDDLQPEDVQESTVTQPDDLWILGDHLLYCGSALEDQSYVRLLKDQVVQMVITDPPYNVKIDGHVCGNGATKHKEFSMASGEMSESEFINFLRASFTLM